MLLCLIFPEKGRGKYDKEVGSMLEAYMIQIVHVRNTYLVALLVIISCRITCHDTWINLLCYCVTVLLCYYESVRILNSTISEFPIASPLSPYPRSSWHIQFVSGYLKVSAGSSIVLDLSLTLKGKWKYAEKMTIHRESAVFLSEQKVDWKQLPHKHIPVQNWPCIGLIVMVPGWVLKMAEGGHQW